MKWKDKLEIDRIEMEVVLNCINIQERTGKFSKFEFKKKLDTIWCKDYNKGVCNLHDNHDQLF